MVEEQMAEEKDVKAEIERLEAARVQKARDEIQAICDKYGVQLQGIVTLPTTEIRIVPVR